MKDEKKTKNQLIDELKSVHQRIVELKKRDADNPGVTEEIREREANFQNILESTVSIFYQGIATHKRVE